MVPANTADPATPTTTTATTTAGFQVVVRLAAAHATRKHAARELLGVADACGQCMYQCLQNNSHKHLHQNVLLQPVAWRHGYISLDGKHGDKQCVGTAPQTSTVFDQWWLSDCTLNRTHSVCRENFGATVTTDQTARPFCTSADCAPLEQEQTCVFTTGMGVASVQPNSMSVEGRQHA